MESCRTEKTAIFRPITYEIPFRSHKIKDERGGIDFFIRGFSGHYAFLYLNIETLHIDCNAYST